MDNFGHNLVAKIQRGHNESTQTHATRIVALSMTQGARVDCNYNLIHTKTYQIPKTLDSSSNESQIQFGRPKYATNIEMWLQVQFENAYGARIYLDHLGRYAICIQSHPTPLIYTPQVVYRDDRYYDFDGNMYLFTANPLEVDPMSNPSKYQVVNSFRVNRIPSDNKTFGLFYQNEDGYRIYYQIQNPITDESESISTVYVMVKQDGPDIIDFWMDDVYGQIYQMILQQEAYLYTYQGVSIKEWLMHMESQKRVTLENPGWDEELNENSRIKEFQTNKFWDH